MASDTDDGSELQPEVGKRDTSKGSLWERGRALLGMALAAIHGASQGLVWNSRGAALWWAGTLPGVGLTDESGPPPPEVSHGVPLLGELLVTRFQFITQEQLDEALNEQLWEGSARHRVGEVLLRARRLTRSQLATALECQRLLICSAFDGRRAAPPLRT